MNVDRYVGEPILSKKQAGSKPYPRLLHQNQDISNNARSLERRSMIGYKYFDFHDQALEPASFAPNPRTVHMMNDDDQMLAYVITKKWFKH